MHKVVTDEKQIGETFKKDGGNTQLDQVLNGNLAVLLDTLNYNLWHKRGEVGWNAGLASVLVHKR